MGHVKQYVVFVRANATAFFNLLIHRARYEVTRRQVFQRRRIALHKALAVGIAQNTAFTTHAFGNQYACARHAGRVELPELHVLQRNACARCHAETVARIDERIG